MTFLLVWLVLAVVVGLAARSRGHSGIAWFLLALHISPLLGTLLVIALPRLHRSGHWMLISPVPRLVRAAPIERTPEYCATGRAASHARDGDRAIDVTAPCDPRCLQKHDATEFVRDRMGG